MSGDDGFLARWARRKRGAAARPREPAKPERAKPEEVAGSGAAAEAAAASAAPPPKEAPFDPASLPPIDSIGASSDIRAFLAPGVPAGLTRAALRRAWSADPAIRDFIGLSENAWDFNAPGGVPGFGPISADEVRRLLEQVTGEPKAAEKAPADDVPAAAAPNPVPEQPRPDRIAENGPRAPVPVDKNDTAAQHEMGESEARPQVARRGHGGALPQ